MQRKAVLRRKGLCRTAGLPTSVLPLADLSHWAGHSVSLWSSFSYTTWKQYYPPPRILNHLRSIQCLEWDLAHGLVILAVNFILPRQNPVTSFSLWAFQSPCLI